MNTDVIVLGAGAAGLMCAIEAAKRGRRVRVLDHANKVGKKILMSGGGRCNFTHLSATPACYLSHNPHFCKSALSRYTPWDFLALVKKHGIAYHEKTPGQLFCDHSAKDIVQMLLTEIDDAGAEIQLNTHIEQITKTHVGFRVDTSQGSESCTSLVVATGGLSIPTMGASPLGYHIAAQFDIPVWPTRAGLVPLTLHVADKARLASLSGISLEGRVHNDDIAFSEEILITHRGLSGPGILQISSYWEPGETIHIQLLPQLDWINFLKMSRAQHPKRTLLHILSDKIPKRFVEAFIDEHVRATTMATFSDAHLQSVAQSFEDWQIKPNATEGYRTAEVTLGGVDCDALSSKTMEALHVPGLYFIGEVVDVTGWLGGYNFQWAWASGWAAGQYV